MAARLTSAVGSRGVTVRLEEEVALLLSFRVVTRAVDASALGRCTLAEVGFEGTYVWDGRRRAEDGSYSEPAVAAVVSAAVDIPAVSGRRIRSRASV